MAKTSSTDDDREIELKLTIDAADVAAFRALPQLKEKCIGRPARCRMLNIYFDTPGRALSHHAMALRLRKTGQKWVQTLKTAGTSTGGLHQRGEWEYALRAPQLDLAKFRDTPLATLAQSKALHLTLKPVFTIDFERTTWLIEMAPGQCAEVSLDQGAIRCGDRTAAISEVEIELKEGSADTMFDLAALLVAQVAMRPAILSKAERGFRLLAPEPVIPRHAVAVRLSRKWSPHHAMQAIFASCLDHFGGNVDGALASDDPEFIHQLRVALRRLRSALRVFRPVHAGQASAELKWLAAAMGEARDWDVLVTQTLPALLDDFGEPRLTRRLMASAKKRQAHARAAARAALTSARAALAVMTIAHAVNACRNELPPAPHDATNDDARQALPTQTLAAFASHEIRRRRRKLLRIKGTLADQPAETRHRVRIDAKRLRYALEFFSSLYARKQVARYLKVLGSIQDLLGGTNDDALAMKLIETLAPPAAFSDFARRGFAARTEERLAEVDRHISALKKSRHGWRQ